MCAEDTAMAIAIRLPSPVTEADLLTMSETNPGYRIERRADGRIDVSPSGSYNNLAESEVFLQLSRWNAARGAGAAFSSSAGFTFNDGSILSPDATYITNDRLAHADADGTRRAYILVQPSVVFELLSASDSRESVRHKVATYLANGVDLVVVLDPREGTVTLDRPAAKTLVFPEPATVECSPEMAGFVLEPAPIFALARREPTP
jgi:Uma2 family endonuclease